MPNIAESVPRSWGSPAEHEWSPSWASSSSRHSGALGTSQEFMGSEREVLFGALLSFGAANPGGLGQADIAGRLLPMIRRGASSGSRRIEERWRREHSEVLRSYAGQWVALEGERIVAHGSDPAVVVIDARAEGIKTPYVFFVHQEEAGTALLGL